MQNPQAVFGGLPVSLRSELLHHYHSICANYVEHRWEPAELNGGKLCEVVYTILKGALEDAYPPCASKPTRFADACRALEQLPGDKSRIGDHSLRVLIPRALVFLYDIRNNRGVGHVGGDVNPNAMDAGIVHATASWVMAELVRVFHSLTPAEAQEVVSSLVERRVPLIWELEGIRRVLRSELSTDEQVLLLLYKEEGWCDVVDLVRWIEYSNVSVFRQKRLGPLHSARQIEFDRASDRVHILPPGAARVEEEILPDSGYSS